MNLNKVLIIGRLTAEPQLRQTPSGQSVASFSVATNRVWNDRNGQKQEQVEFHNIVLWGKQAEIASQYLVKGQVAYIEGRLQTRAWEGQDGQKRRTTEIIGENIQFGQKPMGGGRGAGAQAAGQEPGGADRPEEIPTIEMEDDIKPEDIPF